MNSSTLVLSLTILVSSFLGSWHCAAMCSPIASLMAHKRSLWSYHLGRGLSYILCGAFGGYIGSVFFTHELLRVRIYSGILFALILFFMGIHIFRGKKLNLPHWRWIKFIYHPQTPGFIIGLLSVFLPCGWLYSYIFASIATQSVRGGILVMSLFWIGGLPALSSVSIIMQKSIQLAPSKKQTIAGVILIFASLYSLTSFYFLH